jgi:hypothetical protein
MLHILETLKDEISKEDIQKSEELYKTLQELEGVSIDSVIAEMDERIWIAFEANRKAIVLGQVATSNNYRKIKETNEAYSKAMNEKQGTISKHNHKIQDVRNSLITLIQPVGLRAGKMIDQEIENHYNKAIFRNIGEERFAFEDNRKGTSEIKVWYITVEHNFKAISKIIGLLREFKNTKEKNTIPQILGVIEKLEDDVNDIDIKTLEQMEIPKGNYADLKGNGLITGEWKSVSNVIAPSGRRQ